MSFTELQANYENEPLLSHMRKRFVKYVPGEGYTAPKVLLVGEAPGKFENFHRRPFIGPAGKLLRELMALADLSLDKNAYVTNVVKYRPLDNKNNNRTPTSTEVRASTPYLIQEWTLLECPQIIVPIGAVAKDVFLPDNSPRIMTISGLSFALPHYTVVPMVHPAYILRNESTLEHYQDEWRQFGEQLAHGILPRPTV